MVVHGRLPTTVQLALLGATTSPACICGGQDVRSKRSISIHCCTMTISIEPLDEAPMVLEAEKRAAGIPEDAFITLRHGAMLQTANGSDLNKPLLMVVHKSS